MGTFLDILLPCGYGPPGSLPQPLPGGVDGGSSDIPTQPPGGGPGIIINPGEPVPPIIPGIKPPFTPPVIINNDVVNVDQDEGGVLIVTDVPTEASGTCTGPGGIPIIVVFTPNVFLTSHLLTFTGLSPGTLYTYSILCRRQTNPNLKVIATGSFTTLPIVQPNAPVLTGNDVLSVDQNEGTVFIQTDIPTEASGVCVAPDGITFVTVFNPNVYLTEHTLTFTGLSPGTAYLYSVICKESSPQHLSVVATGGFTTLQIIDPQGNGNAGQFEGIGVSVNTQNNIYDPYIQKTLYEENQVDLKYTPYTIVPTGFKATYGIKGANILTTIRHKSIENIVTNRVASFEEANLDKENTTLSDVKSSLRRDVARSIENIKYPNGIPVPQETILTAVRKHIFEGSIEQVDRDYILSFPPKTTPARVIKPSIQKSGYGLKINDIARSRIITSSVPVETGLTRNINEGLQIIRHKAQSLNPDAYVTDSKELLKLWYFVPEDINKRVEYIDANGEVQSYYINNDESVVYSTSSGASSIAYVTIHDTLDFVLEDASESDYYVRSDVHKAVTLNNSDDLLAKFHLGVVDDILLQASSTRSIELSGTPELTNSHYILTVIPSSIRDSSNNESPFIIESHVSYSVKNHSASDVESVNDIVKFGAYPWKVLFIDFNDPILDYFEYTDTSIQTTFKDISLNSIGAKLSSSEQLYVRKIPKTIIIIPTDRTKYNLFNGKSALVDWNVRQIRFEKSPDTQLLSPGLTYTPLKIENTYLNSSGESKSGYFSTQAYHCVYDETQSTYNSSFKDSTARPTRSTPGIRKALNVVTSLSANYEIDNGLTYYDVYSRLNRAELYDLDATIPKSIINKLAAGEQTGVKLYHIPSVKNSDIVKRASPTRIIELKPNASEEFASEYVEPNLIETQIELTQNAGSFLSA